MRNFIKYQRYFTYLQNREYCKGLGFINRVKENFKKEYESDKQIKENLEKFKKTTKDIEESEQIKKIRDIYKKLESEVPLDAGEKMSKYFKNTYEKLQKETDNLKKLELIQGLANNMQKVMDSLPKDIKNYESLKQLWKIGEMMENELINDRNRIYKAPKRLQTRDEVAGREKEVKQVMKANESATGMELHKEARWRSMWSDIKDNNYYMQKLFDLKMKFDESESLPVRSFRWVTDKISDRFSRIGGENDTAATVKEINKIDSDFTIEDFLSFCQFRVIPNVYEAWLRCDTEILRDWCHDAPYNVILTTMKPDLDMGHKFDSLLLDVSHVELVAGQILEGNPVLVITFEAQIIDVQRDKSGKVVRGDPNKVKRVSHNWALCRDQNELDPWAAWRLIDFNMSIRDQTF